jgi:WD40 repeat protein
MWFAGIPERLFLAGGDYKRPKGKGTEDTANDPEATDDEGSDNSDGTSNVGVWDISLSKPVRTATITHPEPMYWCGPAAGGAAIFTAGKKTAKLSDATTGAPRGKPLELTAPPQFAVADPAGERFAIVEPDGGVLVWNAPDGKPTRFAAGAKTVEFSSDGRVLLVISEKAARAWNPSTGQPLSDAVPELDRDAVVQAHLNFDGTRVVQWDAHGKSGQHSARVWDTVTGRMICTLAQHWQGIKTARFSPDGTLVATGGTDQMVHLCDARTGAGVVPPMRHPQQVSDLGFSADGLLLWALADSDLIVWDTLAGEQVTPRLRHYCAPAFIATNAGARRIAMLGRTGKPRIWDLRAETRPTSELHSIAHALSAHTLVAGSSALRPLLPMEALTAWRNARASLGAWGD